MFNDLNPPRSPADGGVFVRQESDRFIVTWHRVPQFREGGENTFQVILFADGRIRFGYQGLTADGFGDGSTTDTLDLFVGLSPGRFIDDPALRLVDYRGDTPLSIGVRDAVIEHFTEDGSFDLEGMFLLFEPNATDGYDARVGSEP